ncbi:MAG: hypothetical protein PHH28_05605 [Desulfuromonadaceae bacterium]|nr:hypothetical protein [Desulfuromonadaceae bacterium]
MQLHGWLNITTFTIFTLAILLIGLPFSMYLLCKGQEGFSKYGIKKLPINFMFAQGMGRYAIEITFYGLLLLVISIWFLFFDKGGQLKNLFTLLKRLV